MIEILSAVGVYEEWYLCRRKAPFIYKMMWWHKTYCNVHALAHSSKKIWDEFACCRHTRNQYCFVVDISSDAFKVHKFMSRSTPWSMIDSYLFPLLWSTCMTPSRWIHRHSDQHASPASRPITKYHQEISTTDGCIADIFCSSLFKLWGTAAASAWCVWIFLNLGFLLAWLPPAPGFFAPKKMFYDSLLRNSY